MGAKLANLKLIIALVSDPIPEGRPIQELCQGSPFCRCHKKERVVGGTLLSQYKKGIRTPETRAANAEYMRTHRKKTNGTS